MTRVTGINWDDQDGKGEWDDCDDWANQDGCDGKSDWMTTMTAITGMTAGMTNIDCYYREKWDGWDDWDDENDLENKDDWMTRMTRVSGMTGMTGVVRMTVR